MFNTVMDISATGRNLEPGDNSLLSSIDSKGYFLVQSGTHQWHNVEKNLFVTLAKGQFNVKIEDEKHSYIIPANIMIRLIYFIDKCWYDY